MTASRDEKIGRLDITVNDSLGVCGVQRIGDVDGNVQQALHLQRTPIDHVLQSGAVEKLHGDKCFAIFLANVVNGANAGMI
ncbi:MAG: hypothetical protein WCA38_00605 [Candidatus Acidiferrales bacterium]